MFTRDNHENRYNVLVSIDKDAPHVFVKITDKLNYAVYVITIDHLALQNMMVCQNHQQLYDIMETSFTPPSTFAVNITQTCNVDIHCELSTRYQLDFKMKLVEQQQTTEKMNQTLLLQTTQRYDETISKLVAKLEQLETTVQAQNATLMNAMTCIGIGHYTANGAHYSPAMVPLGIGQLVLSKGDVQYGNAFNAINSHSLVGQPGQLQLTQIYWKQLVSLPHLTRLDINLQNLPEFSLQAIIHRGIKWLHLHYFSNATMESLDQFESLEELQLSNSSALKSLHQYLPTSLKRLTVTGCQPLMEAEKPSLENVCKKRNIHLTIR
jgi:hypothetical protein